MRVPVVRAHSVAVNAEFERPVSVAADAELLRKLKIPRAEVGEKYNLVPRVKAELWRAQIEAGKGGGRGRGAGRGRVRGRSAAAGVLFDLNE